MEQAIEPTPAKKLLTTILLAVVSGLVGFFVKAVLDASNLLDPAAATVARWLDTHVSASQLGWGLALVVALGLWAILYRQYRTARWGRRWSKRVNEPTRRAALQEIIEALYDQRYFLPDFQPSIELQILRRRFDGTVLHKRTSHLKESMLLADVLTDLSQRGLLKKAQRQVTDSIRADWGRLVPYVKRAILQLAQRYPFLNLDDLPPLSRDEQEVADLRWSIADRIFREVWEEFKQRMLERGLDLDNGELTWSDWPDLNEEAKYYAAETARVVKDRIGIDIALVEQTLSRDHHRLASNIRMRADWPYSRVLQVVNKFCGTFSYPAMIAEQISTPIRNQVEPMLEKPMAVGASPKWVDAVRKQMHART